MSVQQRLALGNTILQVNVKDCCGRIDDRLE